MPIDTIKLKAYIDSDTATKIRDTCVVKQAIDMKSGELVYQFTTGSLSGTYDSRISIKVDVDFEPYVIVECSLHKIVLGHNVFGGTDDIQSGVGYLHGLLQDLLGIQFPFCFRKWKLMRIDLAEVYELDCFEACQDWFKGLNTCDYPRRKVQRYGFESVCAYGSTTGLKFYHKGPEFWKHDRKRLKDIETIDIDQLQERANNIIRTEVEIKSRKLKDMYGDYPYVGSVKMEELYAIFDREVFRFIKEGLSDMKMVKNAHDVKNRLYQLYSDELAGRLLGMWYQLTTLGEDSVKKSTKKTTYYRNIKYLKDAGISWHGTDVVMIESSLVPKDFAPVRTDKRRVVGECLEMQEKLNPFRIAI